MKIDSDIAMKLRAGANLSSIIVNPVAPFSPHVIDFLSDLSQRLRFSTEVRSYPDVASFAFWCRRSNLEKIAKEFSAVNIRLGRGLVFHVAPSNVPVNFAFTWAFGMLAGNANVVRVSEIDRPQTDIICRYVNELFGDPKHARIASSNQIVQYPRSDLISASLSRIADARVFWGGDQTIEHLRSLPSSPRCIDVAFADRYSMAVLDAQSVNNVDGEGLERLTRGFYNDVYLQDQGACSSPHLIVWLGDAESVRSAKKRFWSRLEEIVNRAYRLDPILAVDKFVHLCRTAVVLPQVSEFHRCGISIYRLNLSDLPPDIEMHRGAAGFFYEYETTGLDCLREIVGPRYQTLTTFGVDRAFLARQVLDMGLRGIDRIVPVGQALSIGVVWDGYDLISTLSRIVFVQ